MGSKKKVDLSHLAERWPSSIVSRQEIGTFTGGAIKAGRLANLDSEGKGPEGRFKLGRKTVYPVEKVVEWLEKRAKALA